VVDTRVSDLRAGCAGERLDSENPTQPGTCATRLRPWIAAAALLSLQLTACAAFQGIAVVPAPELRETVAAVEVTEIYARADDTRSLLLELEVKRLRADLHEAEESLIAIESGLLGVQGRADAVSALAETRIEIARAARHAPWSIERIEEARQKLAEAERQFQAGHTGSAVFFASRAQRIADGLNDEARRVANTPSATFTHAYRVNLRAGPSTQHEVLAVLVSSTPVFREHSDGDWLMVRTTTGVVGWIHASLVREDASRSSQTQTQSLPASLAR
jgi:hypothetical protein